MNKRYIYKIVLIFFLAVLTYVIIVKIQFMPPKSFPLTVSNLKNQAPEEFVFRGGLDGGYFIRLIRQDLKLSGGIDLPAYQLTVLHSYSGDVEYDGQAIFASSRQIDSNGDPYFFDPPPLGEILETAYFNTGILIFPIGGVPGAGKIIPIDF